MNLEDYIDQLQNLVKKRPKAAKMEVVYSKDNSGFSHLQVHHAPQIGHFLLVFKSEEECKRGRGRTTMNAVCIN